MPLFSFLTSTPSLLLFFPLILFILVQLWCDPKSKHVFTRTSQMYDLQRLLWSWSKLLCLVAQSCLTLWDPMECSPPGSSIHGNSPGKNIGMGCHALLQGIFPTQGLNPGLLHCRWILYCLSHQGSPRILKWVPLLQRNFLTQGLLHCRWILYQLSYQGSLKQATLML